MTYYHDDAIQLDEHGITIRNNVAPGHRRHIPYRAIRAARIIELGPLSGHHRLVGLGFRRPRHFFHWDRSRATKTHGIALDTDQFFHVVITPTNHRPVLDAIEQHSAVTPDA